jgi:hypothetical protein
LTHRQHVMLCYWNNDEWNRPDRTDHYLMLLNTTVTRLFHKTPMSVRLEQSKLEFSTGGKSKPSKEEMDRRVAASKAAWGAAAGGRKTMTIIDREGRVLRPPLEPPKSKQFYGKLGSAPGPGPKGRTPRQLGAVPRGRIRGGRDAR